MATIITEEKLKENETRKFIENAFRDGEIRTTGTDIDKLMPPVSRFGGGKRAEKKQTVIDKLKGFFERFFGIGGSFKSDIQQNGVVKDGSESKKGIYDFTSHTRLKAAEGTTEYGKK